MLCWDTVVVGLKEERRRWVDATGERGGCDVGGAWWRVCGAIRIVKAEYGGRMVKAD
jgi:hypothetical protein